LNQRRDEVSTKTPISYSDIPENLNIFDTRFTGCGKTTAALNYIADIVNKKRPVIVMMQSYERLENNYEPQLIEANVKTIVFKGKSQKDMCIHSKEYKEIWDKKKTPKNECADCQASDKCAYKKQLKDLNELSQSKQGYCVLTTEKNFDRIYPIVRDQKPVLIIDDIPLSSVVMPEKEIDLYILETLVLFLKRIDLKLDHLSELAPLLSTYTDEKKKDLISYIRTNESALLGELSLFLSDHLGDAKLPSHPALSFIYHIIHSVKYGKILHFYSEFQKLKLVSDETAKFSSFRMCYLNATPSQKDTYCIKQLGDYEPLTAKVEESKKYVIFQIIDSATTKKSVKSSSRMRSDVQELTKEIKPTLSAIEQKLLVFGHEGTFKTWAKHDVFSGLEIATKYYFGSNTRGTNDYKDYPVSLILGTPYYPPEYFLHPSFEPVWKTKEQFDKEKKENPKGFHSYVDQSVANEEAKINLLQMIGRNLRDSDTNPKAAKIVIVFTSIDIIQACKDQNGGNVIPTEIRGDIQVRQGKKKGETRFFDKYKRVAQEALKPRIKRYIEKHIDNLFNATNNKPLPLEVVATEIQERITVYGKDGIKGLIGEIYTIGPDHDNKNKNRAKSAFILKKRAI
jgi:hypothetical protein